MATEMRVATCGDCIHADICKQLNGSWSAVTTRHIAKDSKTEQTMRKWCGVRIAECLKKTQKQEQGIAGENLVICTQHRMVSVPTEKGERMAKSNCDNCYYSKKIYETRYCAYLLMTNERRPCDPGEGCTVKVARVVKRRKEKKHAD